MNRLVKYPPDAITATVEKPLHPPQWPTNISQSVRVVRKKKSITRSEHEADRMSNASEASYEIISNISSQTPPLETTSTSVQTSDSQLTLVSQGDTSLTPTCNEPICGHQPYIQDLTSYIHSLESQLNYYKYQVEMNIQPGSAVNCCGHEATIQNLTSQVSSLENELQSSRSDNEQLKCELTKIQEEMSKSECKEQATETADLPSVTTEENDAETLKQLIVVRDDEMLRLKSEIESLRLHSDRIIASERHMNARHLSSIQKELRECKSALELMTQEASTYKTQVESLESSLATKESLTAQLAQEKLSIMTETESSRCLIDNLRKELETLRSQQSSDSTVAISPVAVSSIQLGNEQSREQMDTLKKQVNQLESEKQCLEVTRDRLNAELKSVTQRYEEEISRLNMDYSERIEKLRDENLRNETVQSDLEQSLNATRQELLQVLQKLHAISKSTMLLDLPVITTTATNRVPSDTSSLQQSNTDDRQSLLDEIQSLKDQIIAKDKAIDDLTNNLAQYASYYQTETNRLTHEVASANFKASTLESDLEKCRETINQMHCDQQQLKDSLNRAINRNSRLRNEMALNSVAIKEDVVSTIQFLEQFLDDSNQSVSSVPINQQQQLLQQVNTLADQVGRIDV